MKKLIKFQVSSWDTFLDSLQPKVRSYVEAICERAGTSDADASVLVAAAEMLVEKDLADYN